MDWPGNVKLDLYWGWGLVVGVVLMVVVGVVVQGRGMFKGVERSGVAGGRGWGRGESQ